MKAVLGVLEEKDVSVRVCVVRSQFVEALGWMTKEQVTLLQNFGEVLYIDSRAKTFDNVYQLFTACLMCDLYSVLADSNDKFRLSTT